MTRQNRDCVFCGKTLSINGLQAHLQSHINERPVLCKFCHHECRSGQTYQTHVKIHHPRELQRQLNCPFCDKYYTLSSDLTNHIRTHTGETPFTCNICHKSFSQRTSWRTHIQSHSATKIHECDSCPLKFAKLIQLRRHKANVHERVYNFVCPICQKRFHNPTILRSHIKTHTNEKAYKCSICDESYKQSATLKQHYLKEHSGASYKVSCNICSAEVPPWGLRLHLASHTKPHKCPVCEKGFAEKSVMEIHRKLHTERGLKVFECKICQKSYDTLRGKRKHEKRHSSQFPCTICGKVFSGLSNQIMHMRRHSNDKRLSCVFCEKRFTELPELQSHILIHVDEKPWLCNECPYETRGSGQLKKHKLRYHKGLYKKPEKIHACSICDMKFSWKGNLVRHLRFHTGEKPYQCSTCNKRYAKKLNREIIHMVSTQEISDYRIWFNGYGIRVKKLKIPQVASEHFSYKFMARELEPVFVNTGCRLV